MIGVLGLGSIGFRHGKNLKALGEDVIGFDPSLEQKAKAKASGIPVVASREELLQTSTAVVIASPNAFHLEDLKDAVAANCHCLVEKPLAHSIEGLEKLLIEARDRNLHISAAFNLRFDPAVISTKVLLEKGAIGEPLWAILQSSHYLPDWRPSQDYREGYTADPRTGGVLFDIIHEFDLANFLFGPAKTLTAAARNTGTIAIPSEDCADVLLAHQSGLHSNIHLDYVTRPTRRITTIGGNEGLLMIDLVGRKVTQLDPDGNLCLEDSYASVPFAEDYIKEMSSFLDCIRNNKKPPCDGFEALAILEQVLAARHICELPE